MLLEHSWKKKTTVAGIAVALGLLMTGCGRPLDLPVEGAIPVLDLGGSSLPSDAEILEIASKARIDSSVPRLIVDYPLDHSVFPPEIVAPDFRFLDREKDVERWLIHIDLTPDGGQLFVLTDADPGRKPSVIDERCVTDSNVSKPTARENAVRQWTPDEATWQMIKAASVERDVMVTIYGLSENLRRVVSEGQVAIRTSGDALGALLFYRDVPLMPSENVDGVVKPLAQGALPLIAWRLRDVSQPESKVVMEGMPTCANCHSFSADGATIGMDMDGPSGDKGAYAITRVTPETVIESDDVFSWNDFNPDRVTFGLFSRVSPNGRYVVSSVDEEVFVANYVDYRFLQTFYPTGGILAIYDREKDTITPLPGADDPAFVHCNAAWSPDGSTLAFLRAPARPARPAGMIQPTYSNDPNEPRMQYDIYTIPFNDGRGGEPLVLEGASGNGKSNSFPKYSPDGRWLVYVQAQNGLLMRPDGELFIVPAQGGVARKMTCNTDLMNSWHSWSPNSRWLVFSSKSNRPYTQMFLTHVDEEGNDTPAILVPRSTADNRAVNLPEFANIRPEELEEILTPAVDYRRLLDHAASLRDQGDLEASEEALRQSLELRPDFSETRRIYAGVLAEVGKDDQAIDAYKKLIKVEGENSKALSNLGFLLNRKGNVTEAVAAYRRSLDLEPDNPSANLNLGAIFAKLGENEKAVKHLEQALESEPGNASAHRILGLVLDRSGHAGLAIPHLERALQADPNQVNLRRKLALSYVRLGRDEDAIPHLQWLSERQPRDVSVKNSLGFALDRSGHHEEAIEQFSAVVAIDPGADSAWVNWGVALAGLGRHDEAQEKFRKALEINPGNSSAVNNLEKIVRER